MKISLDSPGSANIITAYTDGQISVNQTPFNCSLIVSSKTFIPDWAPQDINAITEENAQQLIDLEVDIILLGSGRLQQFPSQDIYFQFARAGIGLEVMTTEAACRTYSVLIGDGRSVAAGLILNQS